MDGTVGCQYGFEVFQEKLVLVEAGERNVEVERKRFDVFFPEISLKKTIPTGRTQALLGSETWGVENENDFFIHSSHRFTNLLSRRTMK